jgi:tetratricopeptide (TPR) repeat protein
MTSAFASEGFDLDAMAVGQEGGDDVIYELGGGATVIPKEEAMPAKERSPNGNENEESKDEMHASEEWKRQGNEQFKDGNYLEAYDMYTNAIEACPDALSAEEILKQRDEFKEAEREKAFSRQRLDEETRRNRNKEDTANKEPERPQPIPEFQLPPQPHADKLSVYYCNRAATLIHLERYPEAINDCDVSILLQPTYTKAFVRRSSAFEKSDQTEEALRDAKTALELEPTNAMIRKTVARLQKIEDERLEKLKAETLGKLKDLGNSILGNFGLSLDNFQAVQDPKTGSYSISFNQK